MKTPNQKLAERLKKKSDLYPKKINNVKYMLSYEQGYYVAKVFFKNQVCDEVFLMSEETFLKFLDGEEISRNRRISGSMLRETYNIYVPNTATGYLL